MDQQFLSFVDLHALALGFTAICALCALAYAMGARDKVKQLEKDMLSKTDINNLIACNNAMFAELKNLLVNQEVLQRYDLSGVDPEKAIDLSIYEKK